MYFEEYKEGQSFVLPSISLTGKEIKAFANQYDPRPFHLEEASAEKTRFGGLIASGFHTLVACWSVWVKTGIDAKGMVCGIQINHVKWLKPVYANDQLSGVVIVTKKIPTSKPVTGVVTLELTVTNQKEDVVMISSVDGLIKKQPTK